MRSGRVRLAKSAFGASLYPAFWILGSQNRWISTTPIYIGIPFVNGSHDPLGLTAVTPRKNEATGTKTDRSPSSEGVVAVSAAQDLHKPYVQQHSRCVRGAFGSRKVRSGVIHFRCTGSLRFSNYPIQMYGEILPGCHCYYIAFPYS